MHNWLGDLMHYAICNIHPFPPYPELGITKSNALRRFMHYNNMHYENFNCNSQNFSKLTQLIHTLLCIQVPELVVRPITTVASLYTRLSNRMCSIILPFFRKDRYWKNWAKAGWCISRLYVYNLLVVVLIELFLSLPNRRHGEFAKELLVPA